MLQLWDVGGHNIGSNMLNTYVFGAHAVLFVYDVTNAQSFENICDWIAIVKKMSRQMEKVFFSTYLVFWFKTYVYGKARQISFA